MTQTPDIAARQSPGARSYQEDCLGHARTAGGRTVLVLADGMGGHVGGKVASALAVREALAVLVADPREPGLVLSEALEAANNAIADAAEADRRLADMGTTLVCAIEEDGRLYWISVGDSHLYLHRNGVLTKLNADHSMYPVLERMVRDGEIDAAEAARDPRRNMLRSAVTGGEIELVDLLSEGRDLNLGDVLLLASDGLDTLPPEEIAFHINEAASGPLDRAAAGLIGAVEAAGVPNQDNTSVLLARYRAAEEGFTTRPASAAKTPPAAVPGKGQGPWRFVAFALIGALIALLMVTIMLNSGGARRLADAEATHANTVTTFAAAIAERDALVRDVAADLQTGDAQGALSRIVQAMGGDILPDPDPEADADAETPPAPEDESAGTGSQDLPDPADETDPTPETERSE